MLNISDLEEYSHGGAGGEGAHLPLAGVAHAHLLVRHARALHVQGHARTDRARYWNKRGTLLCMFEFCVEICYIVAM